MRYLVGIDNGGTFSKAAVFDEDGRQMFASSAPTIILTPQSGYAQRDMEQLWEINARVTREAITGSGIDPGDIAGVSFSGHGKGLYLIGYDGKPSYPGILSTDTRAWKQVKRWYENDTNRRVFEKTFQEILPSQPVSLLAWLLENEPEVLERTQYIFSVKDYIRFRMTGEAAADYTDSSGSNFIDMRTGQYDRELMELFGLGRCFSKLPPLRQSAQLCGRVTKEASHKTLLPEGTPVATGMFDVDACGIASGLCDEEMMCMIAGTWSINEYIRKTPVTDRSASLNSMFCIPGHYLVEESSPTSAGNLEWFIRNILDSEQREARSKESSSSVYDFTNTWVSSIHPSESSLIFLPFLNGSPENAHARGTFVGLCPSHSKPHMARAIYEGVVFSHATHIQKLLKTRIPPASIRLAGGAAKSDVWVQMFADILQIPVEVVANGELGAQGAAMAAGIAVGLYRDYQEAVRRTVTITKRVMPRPQYRLIYEKKYAAYQTIVKCLTDIWEHLSM